MKIFHLFLSALFLVFALVQWNDPDYYMWMPPYLLVAYISFNAAFEKYYKLWCSLLLILFLFWMSLYFPHIKQWYADGMPSIAETMKAESAYIELAREFFGLLICLISTLYFLILAFKSSK